jgi:hypothetical protein
MGFPAGNTKKFATCAQKTRKNATSGRFIV